MNTLNSYVFALLSRLLIPTNMFVNFILLLLSSCLFYHVTSFSESEIADKNRSVSVVNGEISVRLSEEQDELADLGIYTLNALQYQPQQTVVGKVLSLQSLLEQRSKLQSVAINRINARLKEKLAYTAYQRAEQLASDGITSFANAVKLKQNWLTLRSSSQVFITQENYLKANLHQQWGAVLSEAINQENPVLNKILSGQNSLLLITVPYSQTKLGPDSIIMVSSDGRREFAVPAKFLSESPFNAQVAGNSYFFTASTNNLAIETRVTAWIPTVNETRKGVLIPETAIIWHNARPWVYLKVEDRLYLRRLIVHHQQIKQNWFVADQFSPGEQIVVTGAALLLSEELRSQIPLEDDD